MQTGLSVSTFAPRTTRSVELSSAAPLVFIVDDDVSVRESLELLVATQGWHAETFASANQFLSRPRSASPCCLLLDITLPGLSGLELQARLAGRLDMPIIFVTGYGDVATTVCAMKAGAFDFLTKPVDGNLLLASVRRALEHSRIALQQESQLLALRACYELLTPRERQVMALVVTGLLNKQVAGELGISEITVKAHRGQVMRKMQADSLAALVRIAARLAPRSADAEDSSAGRDVRPMEYPHQWSNGEREEGR